MRARCTITKAALVLFVTLASAVAGHRLMAGDVSDSNIVWNSASANSAGSMPLGNGDIGVNAWVESNGDLLMYIGKTDAWSENNRLLKLGLVRVSGLLSPAQGFRQELKLQDGTIRIDAGQGAGATSLTLWIDANNPVVRIDAQSQSNRSIDVTFEPWRTTTRTLAGGELHSAYDLQGPYPDAPVQVHPDTVVDGQTGRVLWYHRNESSSWRTTMQCQDLNPDNTVATDPLLHNTFGAAIKGANLANINNKTLRSSAPSTSHSIAIHALTAQTDTANQWVQQLDTQITQTESTDVATRRAAHDQWWRDFNDRSYIRVSGDGSAGTVSQGYALQRAVNAFGGRGGSPIKFNGSIFTVDTYNRTMNGIGGYDADFREWGGPYWWQNTRLPYWSMAAAGDTDQMMALFDMYLEALPLAKERVQTYWGHNGAMFPETMCHWGTYAGSNYGWPGQRGSLPPGTSLNQYVRYYWQGGIELTAMMLECHNTTRNDQFLQEKLLPLAESIVTFYDQHYGRDTNGKLDLSGHAQSLETWWTATNPLPEIAGLRFVLDKLLALPAEQTTPEQRAQWTRLRGELPDIPTRMVGDKEIFAPAETYSNKRNSENCELYAVFPYLIAGVGKEDLQMGIDTYNNRYHTGNNGWKQDVIQAALLGMTGEAKSLLASRFAAKDPGSRFPGFYGPNFDWLPDQCHPSVASVALQKMILQVDGDQVELFPAWPTEWDVEFKLHGPAGKIFMGEFADGSVQWMDPTMDGWLDNEDFDLVAANLGFNSGLGSGDADTLALGDVNLDGLVSSLDEESLFLAVVAQRPGDFNFDRFVDFQDWLLLRDNYRQDLSGMSDIEAYGLGDLNRDGFNDATDFGLFKDAFDAANGEGAFETMVPEPSSYVLLVLGGGVLLLRRR